MLLNIKVFDFAMQPSVMISPGAIHNAPLAKAHIEQFIPGMSFWVLLDVFWLGHMI
jgi:hypothetical protein